MMTTKIEVGKMALEEFVVSMRRDLDRFEAEWRRNNAENADDWPSEMFPSDWYEQFLVMFEQSKF
jgi:hypothetical protein